MGQRNSYKRKLARKVKEKDLFLRLACGETRKAIVCIPTCYSTFHRNLHGIGLVVKCSWNSGLGHVLGDWGGGGGSISGREKNLAFDIATRQKPPEPVVWLLPAAGCFPGAKQSERKNDQRLHLVPGLRTCGTVTPLTHTF